MSEDDHDYRQNLPESLHEYFDWLVKHDCKENVAAGAIHYIASHLAGNGPTLTQKTVAEEYDTTEHSISKWYRRLIESANNGEIDGFRFNAGILSFEDWNHIQPDKAYWEKNTGIVTADIIKILSENTGVDIDGQITTKNIQSLLGTGDVMTAINRLDVLGLERGKDYSVYVHVSGKDSIRKLKNALEGD